MYSIKDSEQFVKIGDIAVSKEEIAMLDCSEIESLKVKVVLKSGKELIAEDIHAIELLMQTKPSMIEGKRLLWPKFMWFIHNVFGHPLTQILALFKCYKLAFWIHDVTVPKPIGKKKSKNN